MRSIFLFYSSRAFFCSASYSAYEILADFSSEYALLFDFCFTYFSLGRGLDFLEKWYIDYIWAPLKALIPNRNNPNINLIK